MRGCLGVVGGMGPLVSAEFVRTIYEQGVWDREQDAPRVLLYSDPTFPDRTTALIEERGQVLVEPLAEAIEYLVSAGAAQIVICCVTMHQALPALPPDLRRRVTSLVDVTVDALLESTERHLLLASTGTVRSRLFQQHPRWASIADRVVVPVGADQDRIHRAIYRLKSHEDVDGVLPVIDELMDSYGVGGFIAGCTEMHFISKRANAGRSVVDPLLVIAREWAAQSV